jgi:hypothetical protein
VDVIPFISTKIAPERGLWRATAPATFANVGRVRRSEPSGRNSRYQPKDRPYSSYRPNLPGG